MNATATHMKKVMLFILIVVVAWLMPAGAVLARQQTGSGAVSVTAEVRPPRVFVGETARVQVLVKGSRTPRQPETPIVPGATVEYIGGQDGSSQFTTIINGKRRDEIREEFGFVFGVTPTGPGTITVPPITVMVDGKAYATNPLSIDVLAPQADENARFMMSVDRESPFVGEPVTLTLVLAVRMDFQAPQFAIPGVGLGNDSKFDIASAPVDYIQGKQWMSLDVLGSDTPAAQGRTTIDGKTYTTYTMKKMLIPRSAGKQQLGPGTAALNLILRSGDPFNPARLKKAVVPSNAVDLDVRALPSEGRPANFSGLIGRYTVAAEATPTDVEVGQPIALTVRVSGPLAEAVRAPAIEKQADLVSNFRVASEETAPKFEGSTKTFTRTLRATSPEVTAIPPIELPYFDTAKGRYDIAKSQPIPLRVRSSKMVTAADAVGGSGPVAPVGASVESTTTGIAANSERPEALIDQSFSVTAMVKSPVGAAALVVPPAVYGAAAFVVIAKRRAERDPKKRRRREALANAQRVLGSAGANDPGAIADAVSRGIAGYLADKAGLTSGTVTPAEAESMVRLHDDDLAIRARAIMERCDAARFGGMTITEGEALRGDASRLLDSLEKMYGRGA
ncbi:MAG TPA: BatD family protein [Phycisphaerales bacterium]|nr:BatD family protein [Phycisphaerales bacterium]